MLTTLPAFPQIFIVLPCHNAVFVERCYTVLRPSFVLLYRDSIITSTSRPLHVPTYILYYLLPINTSSFLIHVCYQILNLQSTLIPLFQQPTPDECSVLHLSVGTGQSNCCFHRYLSLIHICDNMESAGVWVVLNNDIHGTVGSADALKGVTHRANQCYGVFWLSEESDWQSISRYLYLAW